MGGKAGCRKPRIVQEAHMKSVVEEVTGTMASIYSIINMQEGAPQYLSPIFCT